MRKARAPAGSRNRNTKHARSESNRSIISKLSGSKRTRRDNTDESYDYDYSELSDVDDSIMEHRGQLKNLAIEMIIKLS